MPRLDEIIALVSAEFRVTPGKVQHSARATRGIEAARRASMWLAAVTGHDFGEIGDAFGLHRIVVHDAVARFDSLLVRDAKIADRMIGLACRVSRLTQEPADQVAAGEFW